MSWTDTQDFKVGRLVTHIAAAQRDSLQSLKANIDFLHTKNMVSYLHDGTGSDWSTNSAVLIKIDDTKFQLTLTTTGGPVMAWFRGNVDRSTAVSTGYMIFTIVREGDPVDNSEPNYPFWAKRWHDFSIWKPFPFLPAGTYTFAVYWALVSGAANLLRLKATAKPMFAVIEGM